MELILESILFPATCSSVSITTPVLELAFLISLFRCFFSAVQAPSHQHTMLKSSALATTDW